MHWFINPIRYHYADFSGRVSRKEYWMFVLSANIFIFFGSIFLLWLAISLQLFDFRISDFYNPTFQGIFFYFYLPCFLFVASFPVFIPIVAIQVRRLHDSGRSGWWIFLLQIPFIGSLVLLVFSCLPSQTGTNEYGLNPYGIGNDSVTPPTSLPEIPTLNV